MKRCPDCREWKPNDEFPRNRRTKDGRHPCCKPCHNVRGRESRERLYGGGRHYHLRRRYGIGAADVEAMIVAQDGPCLNCNGGLGQFRDDVDALLAAADYLTRDDELHAEAVARAQELVQTPG